MRFQLLRTRLRTRMRTTGARGLPRFHGVGDEETVRHARGTSLTRKLEKHKLCLSTPPPTTTTTSSQPEGPTTTSLQPIHIDDNGTPAIWTLVLSSSKSLTGRTGNYRLRDASVYWNHWRYTLNRTLSHYNRTRTHRSYDDMPCRHPLH